jgi:hypothetical protein
MIQSCPRQIQPLSVLGSSIKSNNGVSYDSAIDKDLRTVPVFDADNKTIWNLLKKFLSSTVARSYIMDCLQCRESGWQGRSLEGPFQEL